ncbi:hypothetical protein VFPBJ_06347 [Purpureocillium lilacinum]|uniref:Uncharacterized protein n=1 Tax=Purpureocillium lilacinum TaxID=33203 RepID=A0A179GL43_PURLI|nr:hypothetical protein VFPBJ_06347 [Purpureocillium lilacinum]
MIRRRLPWWPARCRAADTEGTLHLGEPHENMERLACARRDVMRCAALRCDATRCSAVRCDAPQPTPGATSFARVAAGWRLQQIAPSSAPASTIIPGAGGQTKHVKHRQPQQQQQYQQQKQR